MKLIVKNDGYLLDYLYNNLDMPNKKIKQYLQHGSIYVNNNKTTKYNYKISNGMVINIDTENKNRKELPFNIIYEDNHIIVVNKPSGLLTVSTPKEKEKTLFHIVAQYLKSKDKFAKVYIVHRLDKDTSGVVVLAKDEKTKNLLQKNWNENVLLREYTCVVVGKPKKKEDRIEQYLKETKTNLVYPVKNKDGKQAITNYKVIKENKDYSLLKINIETGRKNQIRVAMKSINTPILGDKKYGDKKSKEDRLFLHANKLKMYYPVIKKNILFETEVPQTFKKIMR